MLNEDADRCTATTRDGDRCKNPAVRGSAVCRMHGGAAEGGGAPKGNKNAVTTGEHEAISYGSLTAEERRLWHEVDPDPLAQIDQQIRLLNIRLRRLLRRIGAAEGGDMLLTDRETEEGTRPSAGTAVSVEVTREAYEHEIERIQGIEGDLTRLQSELRKLLREKYRILKKQPADQSEKLDQLLGRMATMREETTRYES